MTKIHGTAIVSPETELGSDIEIGPFSSDLLAIEPLSDLMCK